MCVHTVTVVYLLHGCEVNDVHATHDSNIALFLATLMGRLQ